ncbi:energy transducer TonB [Reyranella sp.]|uniref:energy transducer TonB n=1 Tax=Reyranella sp. TaxID=1929291 RepID=UPI003BAD8792
MPDAFSFLPRLPSTGVAAYREPLTPTVKRALLAAVIFFHVGGGWALTQVEPVKLIVGDIAPMEVRMVAAEPPAAPEIENAEPPPPVEIKPPDLAAIVDPPPPDLPPPEFPIAKLDIPPPPDLPPPEIKVEKPPEPPKPQPKPKPPAPRPVQKRPPVPVGPVETQQQAATPAPSAPATPRTVSASQLGYLSAPNPVYPSRSRKAGEQGTVIVRVLVDVTGRPAQVSLHKSSGHPALDESAVSAVRAAHFRPYAEAGLKQAVWVLVPINFVLR